MQLEKKPYIFISYAHKDSKKVLPIIKGLSDRGFSIWYDAGIQPGTEWSEVIARKIYDSSCVLAFMTENARQSTYCPKEIQFAVDAKKEVLAVYEKIDDQKNLSLGMQLQLNNLQAIFMENSPGDENFLDTLSLADILQKCKIVPQSSDDYIAAPQEDSAQIPKGGTSHNTSASPENTEPAFTEVSISQAAHKLYRSAQAYAEAENWAEAFTAYQNAAKRGHPDAMYQLAECLRLGQGTDPQPDTAYYWYKKAAEAGVTPAMLRQALLYELTNGTNKGREKAFTLFSLAAQLGEVGAMYELGKCYLNGVGTRVDKNEGIAWLKKAADQEHVESMYEIGMYYRHDRRKNDNDSGQKPETETALYWFDSAAYWRHAPSMYELGYIFERAFDNTAAAKWYRKAAEQGHSNAIRRLIELYEQNSEAGELVPEAFPWYKAAADLGDIAAMKKMAEYCRRGICTEKSEIDADKWLHKAAVAGDPQSMFLYGEKLESRWGTAHDCFAWYTKAVNIWPVPQWMFKLSQCYAKGIGTNRDDQNAFVWCKRAAEGNCVDAMISLAEKYNQGQGTTKDPASSFHWYYQAAHFGNADAQYQLAVMYQTGHGTVQDMHEATCWCQHAAENGNPEAMFQLAKYYESGIAMPFDTESIQSEAEAFTWLQKASNAGHAEAAYCLAHYFEEGIGTPADNFEATKQLRLAANRHHCEAMLRYARYCHQTGNKKEAVKWYQRAAQDGNDAAYAVICHALWYQLYLLLHPSIWQEHRDSVSLYRFR